MRRVALLSCLAMLATAGTAAGDPGNDPPPCAIRDLALAMLNKYRCDLRDVRLARSLRLGLPGTGARARASLTLPRGGIAYCGRGDPGSTVSVSPFEPTLRAASSR